MTMPRREDSGDASAFIATAGMDLVDKPPRERPKACAAWPPFFQRAREHADGRGQSSHG